MIPSDVLAALALPPGGATSRRIPKTVLGEHGGLPPADRKLLDRGVERLDWLATLSPAATGVAACSDVDRPVPVIQVLALAVRGELAPRMLLALHRAVPAPVLLATTHGDALTLSVAPLRRAERVADRMVVERLVMAPPLREPADAAAEAFLQSLALPYLPRTTLGAVYEALVWRVEALTAARASGAPFQVPADPAAAATRRAHLANHAALAAEWHAARAAARAEPRLARQVELADVARQMQRRLEAATALLAGDVSHAAAHRPGLVQPIPCRTPA